MSLLSAGTVTVTTQKGREGSRRDPDVTWDVDVEPNVVSVGESLVLPRVQVGGQKVTGEELFPSVGSSREDVRTVSSDLFHTTLNKMITRIPDPILKCWS